jgi:hypothetical protein
MPLQPSLTEATGVKQLSGAPLKNRLLALTINIRLGWRCLPGTNTLAYCEHSSIMDTKSFTTLVPDRE